MIRAEESRSNGREFKTPFVANCGEHFSCTIRWDQGMGTTYIESPVLVNVLCERRQLIIISCKWELEKIEEFLAYKTQLHGE